MITRRSLLTVAAATPMAVIATSADAARQTDLLNPEIYVNPLATGASLVKLVFMLNGWPSRWTYVVRHFCPAGVEMHSQGFAVTPQPGGPGIDGLRNYLRLNNARNLLGDNGEQGFSWYLRNDGPEVGPLLLDINFVARRVQ